MDGKLPWITLSIFLDLCLVVYSLASLDKLSIPKDFREGPNYIGWVLLAIAALGISFLTVVYVRV